MIVITQITIVLISLAILYMGLSNRKTHMGKAWKKLGLIALVMAMVVAVLFPQTTNDLAHLIGIGRGADLLLYALTLAFIMYVLNTYLARQTERDELYRLARKVAIIEANSKYKIS